MVNVCAWELLLQMLQRVECTSWSLGSRCIEVDGPLLQVWQAHCPTIRLNKSKYVEQEVEADQVVQLGVEGNGC